MDDTYRIPDGGVCGAFISEAVADEARVSRGVVASRAREDEVRRVPRGDAWVRVADVVEDLNDREFVPTQVLKDTLEMVRRQRGDEPSTDQQTALTLIEEELATRGDAGDDYAGGSTKDAGRKLGEYEVYEGANGRWMVRDASRPSMGPVASADDEVAAQRIADEYNSGERPIPMAALRPVRAKVVKRDDQWCVTTESGDRTLGCHDSEEEANAQLRAIEVSKHSSLAALGEPTRQAVNEFNRLMRQGNPEPEDVLEQVVEQFGLTPEQAEELRGLVGFEGGEA